MSSGEVEKFIGELSTRLHDWEEHCKANHKSCGPALKLDGTGGKVTMTPFSLGPFI